MKLLPDLHHQTPKALADLHARFKQRFRRQGIDGAQELACVVIERLVSLLEAIQLLDNRDGNDDVILLEVVDTLAVVERNVGVENEEFAIGHPSALTT